VDKSIDWDRRRRLWPNRTHESNWLKDLICWLGFHRWYRVEVTSVRVPLSCAYCRWCDAIRVLGRK